MAVEAHQYLLQTGGLRKLAAAHASWEEGGNGGGGLPCDAPASTATQASVLPGRQHACYYSSGGGRDVVASRGSQLTQGYRQFQQQSCVGLAAAPASTPLMLGRVCAADASKSGVTFGGEQALEVASCRKRKRAAEQSQVFRLGAAGVAAQLQQQLVDVDRLVLQHTAKMWAELTEQSRRDARRVVAAVEAAAAKRLRAKDEEIGRLGCLNRALEERAKSLLVEAQGWRDLAQSNEAAATALRGELQQALDAHARRSAAALAGGGGPDDAASCCHGENDATSGAGDGEEEEVGTTGPRCAVCGEGAGEALLLPGHHMLACAACGYVRDSTGCGKNAKNGAGCHPRIVCSRFQGCFGSTQENCNFLEAIDRHELFS